MNCRTPTQTYLFGQPPEKNRDKHRPVVTGSHLWTAEKAALIDEYIHLFLLVTKHGVYLDLFAGPQKADDTENWSVRKVLERRAQGSPSIDHYAVCDNDSEKAARLRELACRNESVHVYAGDANEQVHNMLKDAPIGPKTACFCLMDQRTFECHWATVRAIAEYKQEGFKIELFYFLAQAWLDRAWQSIRKDKKLEAWWGNKDYAEFLEQRSFERANTLCERFRSELKYTYADPFSIHERGEGSRTMYYMIHASDHPRAVTLMSQAYRKVGGNRNVGGHQIPLLETN